MSEYTVTREQVEKGNKFFDTLDIKAINGFADAHPTMATWLRKTCSYYVYGGPDYVQVDRQKFYGHLDQMWQLRLRASSGFGYLAFEIHATDEFYRGLYTYLGEYVFMGQKPMIDNISIHKKFKDSTWNVYNHDFYQFYKSLTNFERDVIITWHNKEMMARALYNDTRY